MVRDDVRDLGGERVRLLSGERGECFFERSRGGDGPDAVHIAIDDNPAGAEDDDPRAQPLDVFDNMRTVEDRSSPFGEDANEMPQQKDRADIEARLRLVEN